jgi:lysophospholipase L1-like esterase
MRVTEKQSQIIRFLTLVVMLALTGGAVAAPIWNYTALGDSLAFGALALPLKGYTFLYRGDVQADTGSTVLLYNLGVPGWTSSDLFAALHSYFALRTTVRISQVVTFDIGGNDLNAARSSYKAGTCGGIDNQACLQAAVNQLEVNWDGILAELQGLRNFNRTIVRTMTIYNPFVTEDQNSGDFQVLKFYIEQANAYIESKSAAAGVLVAPVYTDFNGVNGDEDPKLKGYIAFDGFHPNTAGHAEIARLLRNLGYSPLH